MWKLMTAFVGVAALIAVLAIDAPAAAAKKNHKTIAKLRSTGPMKATATYQRKQKAGPDYERFKVQVKHGMPLKLYSVRVNGKKYGYLMTNPAGNGKFELRSEADMPDSPPPSCYEMPPSFPTCDTGDVVTVGPCCGVSYDCGDSGLQEYEVEGKVDDDFNGEVNVAYEEDYDGGTLKRTFKVEIEDAAADTSHDVYLNGNYIATITTNAEGEINYKLRTNASSYYDSNDIREPMPDDFPSLVDGDVVTVGSWEVTVHSQNCTCDTGNGNGNGNGGGSGDDGSSDDGSDSDSGDDNSGDDDSSD